MTYNEKGAVRENRGAWDREKNRGDIIKYTHTLKKKRVKCKISSGVTLHPRG